MLLACILHLAAVEVSNASSHLKQTLQAMF